RHGPVGRRITIPCPSAMRDYHRWRGGLDLHDQLRLQRSSLQLSVHFRKSYKTISWGSLTWQWSMPLSSTARCSSGEKQHQLVMRNFGKCYRLSYTRRLMMTSKRYIQLVGMSTCCIFYILLVHTSCLNFLCGFKCVRGSESGPSISVRSALSAEQKLVSASPPDSTVRPAASKTNASTCMI
ncbi:hypothetical protein L916_18207, partial [Phytophthora nicotianae]